MSLFSFTFVLFVAGGGLLYYLLPKRSQWGVLLALSWGFYFSLGLGAMGYLLFVTASSYGAALALEHVNQYGKGLSKEARAIQGPKLKNKKRLIASALFFGNFGLLFFVKYWDFTATVFGTRLGVRFPSLGLVAPLGISYYIFQSAGYVIDVYRGKYEAQHNFLKYALFVSFFPQITQGPIGRYDALAPQLLKSRSFSFENLKAGLQLVLWGCLKKLVVADRAGIVADRVFGDPSAYGGFLLAFGVLFYCVQLYCDFSGGIEIIRGVARIFGICLAENFKRPIFAVSLTDFWRRWHITLGAWMKDYLFYPISLSKPLLKFGKFCRKKIGGRLGKILPTAVPTFLIYFIIGIWHGANWKYIAFGLYNGVLITTGLLLEPWFSTLRTKLSLSQKSRGMRLFGMARTALLVFFGRYLTRAKDLHTGFSMLWKTVRHPIPSQLWNGTLFSLGLSEWDLLVVALGVLLLLFLEFFEEQGRAITEKLEEKPFFLQWLFLAAELFIVLFLGVFRGDFVAAEFIYQQF